jgi:hypothetical protein
MVRVIETPGGADTDVRYDAAEYDANAEELVRDLALHDLVLDEAGDAAELRLVVGDGNGKNTSMTLQPSAILLERQGEADAGIRFEQRNGDRIRLLFRVPAAPETLDGLADSEL